MDTDGASTAGLDRNRRPMREWRPAERSGYKRRGAGGQRAELRRLGKP